MSASFGHILRKSGSYAVAVIATRALSFVLIPLYTRYLDDGRLRHPGTARPDAKPDHRLRRA